MLTLAVIGCGQPRPTASGLDLASPSPSATAPAQVPIPVASGDLLGMAAGAHVDPAAIVPTEDGAIVARRSNGATQLLMIYRKGGTWAVMLLASIAEQWPADSAYASVNVVDCTGHGFVRSLYIFGASTDTIEHQLRLEPSLGLGAALVGDAWAFALGPTVAAGTALKVYGSRPRSFAEIGSLSPTTACLATSR